MKIFILVLLVAVLFYVNSADELPCKANEHPVRCKNWASRNKSCDEGSCQSPTPQKNCEDCQKCFTEDGSDEVCEVKCVCDDDTLRQQDGGCRDPSDCPEDSPVDHLLPNRRK
uniref:Putative til domain protein n=1 Tax=Ixodes ricinus TaxID=34613 RepID=A0A0K8RD22_IXORI